MANIIKYSNSNSNSNYNYNSNSILDVEVVEVSAPTSKLVYYISRVREKKAGLQMRLGETRFEEATGEIKALATLHFKHGFVSGMPAAFVDGDGNTYWTVNRKGEKMFFSILINIPDVLIEKLEKELKQDDKLMERLKNPPKNQNMVSDLRGYQLHITLHPDAMARFNVIDDDFKTGGEQLSVDPSEIKALEIVTKDQEAFLRKGVQISMGAFFQVRCEAENNAVPKTEEETRYYLESLHKSGKVTKDRRKGRNKAAQEAAESGSGSTTTIEMD